MPKAARAKPFGYREGNMQVGEQHHSDRMLRCLRRLQHLDSEVAARPPRSWAHAVFSEEEALRQHGILPKKVRLDQKRSGTHRNRFDAAIIRCKRI
jgi:hypothetical protein